MGRSRAVSSYTTLYRGEGETETEIDVEVSGLVEPYWPGSWEEPPSGGGVDDVLAIFYDGKKPREIQLTDDEVQAISDDLATQDMDDVPEPDYDDYDEPDFD